MYYILNVPKHTYKRLFIKSTGWYATLVRLKIVLSLIRLKIKLKMIMHDYEMVMYGWNQYKIVMFKNDSTKTSSAKQPFWSRI